MRMESDTIRVATVQDAEELLAFISSAYGGIQMNCIVNNCYRHERNPLTAFYQPQIQLRTLARTVNYLIGEESEE